MTPAPDIAIRPLTEPVQFRDAVSLQKEIWQFEDIELLPVRLFVVATKVGGQAFGAYQDGAMVGFALAIPGIKRSYGAYLHGHMVGVSATHRNFGIGRMLKLAQREEALARGIGLMEWTFDPLELKNAYFNMERLGAIIRRHVFNQYGKTTSVLHGGLPTDRCIAEWWLDSDRVKAAIHSRPFARPPTQSRISVPHEIAQIRKTDYPRAREIQSRISHDFTQAFDRGLAVIGFEKTAATGDYLLGEFK